MSDGLPSEHAVAEEYCEAVIACRRFDQDRQRWFGFVGSAWRLLPPGAVLNEIRWETVRLAGGHRSVCKNAFFRGVEAIASRWHGCSVANDSWDSDPMLLGTPGGTVDLRTGDLRPASPRDNITKLTSIVPEKGAPNLWLRFLWEATAGDAALIRFLQQMCGYALTGDTREHALFFIHGPGGNGKGVFLNTVTRIFGDYARTAAMDTFISSRNDRHPTELASLAGARLVTASETEEGRSWAESRIKQMTGGDPITARFMRQDEFTFLPQLKLVIIGNHEPVLRNVDDAARRRFNIIPFRHKPPRVDRGLERKLEAEHGRILNWMIEGCIDWQANGLVQPTIVEEQTDQYFEEQDLFGQWLEDSCELGADLFEEVAGLYASWEKFAHAAGVKPGTSKAFSSALRQRGFRADRLPDRRRQRIYWGLRTLLQPSTPTEERP